MAKKLSFLEKQGKVTNQLSRTISFKTNISGYFCYKRTKTTLCDDLACSRAIRDLLTRAVSIVFMGYNIKTPYYRAAQAKYKRR